VFHITAAVEVAAAYFPLKDVHLGTALDLAPALGLDLLLLPLWTLQQGISWKLHKTEKEVKLKS
jgi:hypothetical protein